MEKKNTAKDCTWNETACVTADSGNLSLQYGLQ